jgi:hypothetical protein
MADFILTVLFAVILMGWGWGLKDLSIKGADATRERRRREQIIRANMRDKP